MRVAAFAVNGLLGVPHWPLHRGRTLAALTAQGFILLLFYRLPYVLGKFQSRPTSLRYQTAGFAKDPFLSTSVSENWLTFNTPFRMAR